MSFIANLGYWLRKISRSFSDVSINGRNITLTRHNGDTEVITTQDTTSSYSPATSSADGLMSSTDKSKLDGIASNAEVNQNAFSNVKVNASTISANEKTDTIELAEGTGITLTVDTANGKVTIKVTDNTYAAASHTHDYFPLNGGALNGTNIVRNTNDAWLWFNGGSAWNEGGQIVLYGPNYSDTSLQGAVRIRAGLSGTSIKDLLCYPDGSLIWASKAVVVCDSVDKTTEGYIRFTNGLQFVWGGATIPSSNPSNGIAVTFEKPFTTTPRIYLATRFANAYGWGYGPQAVDRTATGCTIVCGMSNKGTTAAWSTGAISYFAIGPWS